MRYMRLIFIAIVLVASSARAQDFPDGSTPPSADELKRLLSGKTFEVKVPTGTNWRYQLKENGFFFINVGNYADSGKWSVEDGKLCTEPQKSKASCNEMRLSAGSLFLKRDNGQIVEFMAR